MPGVCFDMDINRMQDTVPNLRWVIQPYLPARHCWSFLPCKSRVGILSGSAGRHPPDLVSWEQDKPEPVVVVPVAGFVPVAIRATTVPGVVVPATAAEDPVRASGQNPKSFNYISSKTLRICCLCKFNQRLHVACERFDWPIAIHPVLFIFPEFISKSLFASFWK